jgi:hypothetical protein
MGASIAPEAPKLCTSLAASMASVLAADSSRSSAAAASSLALKSDLLEACGFFFLPFFLCRVADFLRGRSSRGLLAPAPPPPSVSDDAVSSVAVRSLPGESGWLCMSMSRATVSGVSRVAAAAAARRALLEPRMLAMPSIIFLRCRTFVTPISTKSASDKSFSCHCWMSCDSKYWRYFERPCTQGVHNTIHRYSAQHKKT